MLQHKISELSDMRTQVHFIKFSKVLLFYRNIVHKYGSSRHLFFVVTLIQDDRLSYK